MLPRTTTFLRYWSSVPLKYRPATIGMRVPAAKFSDVPKTSSGLVLRSRKKTRCWVTGPGPAPSSRSTYSSVVLSSSRARASDSDRFGRFNSWLISAPLAKLVTPNRWMKIVFGPIALIMSRSD